MASNLVSGTELAQLRDTIRIDLRSLLCSSKDGLTERELKHEYRELNGKDLPYAQLGYNSLYDMVRDFEFVQVRRHRNGQWVYYAMHDEVTRDLGRLIQGQLDPKKAVREKKRFFEARYLNNRNQSASRYSSRNSYGSSSSSVPPSPYRRYNNGYSSDKPFVINSVQKNIEDLLKRAVNYRLSLYDLDLEFKKIYGYDLNPRNFGYNTLIELFESLDHFVYIDYPKSSSSRSAITDFKNIIIGLEFSKISSNDSNNNNNNNSKTNEKTQQTGQPKSQEDEMVQNLKLLIESYGTEGISLRSIEKAYQDNFNKPLNYEKFGYSDLFMLFSSRLANFIKIEQLNSFNDYKITKKDTDSSLLDKKEDDGEEEDEGDDEEVLETELEKTQESNHVVVKESIKTEIVREQKPKAKFEPLVKELILSLENAFKNHIDVKLSEMEFYSIYEKRNGWKLDHLDYGFSQFENFMSKLAEIGIIITSFDPDFNVLYCYPSSYVEKKLASQTSANEKNKTYFTMNAINKNKNATGMNNRSVLTSDDLEDENYARLDPREKRLYEWRKHQAEFIQEYVIYDSDMEQNALHRKLIEKQDHLIVVSHVSNPCDIQIQLAENVNELNKLMDELEKTYYGVGSGYYDMPIDYIKCGKLCVAVFEVDNNWHRCRIISVNEEAKTVKVSFIDYGGEASVPINSLKFLLKTHSILPIQAIKAKFSGIKFQHYEYRWHKDIVNYLLNRVMGKTLEGHITGIRKDFVAFKITDRTNSGVQINLNQRIIMDGYADAYDEDEDPMFMDFHTWKCDVENSKEYIQLQKALENDLSEASTRSMLSSSTVETSNSFQINSNNNNNNKDYNNNNTETTHNSNNSLNLNKQVVKYKKEDEIDDNTILKQKIVQIDSIQRFQREVTMLSFDKKFYIHFTDVAKLIGIDETLFEVFFIRSETINAYIEDEVYFTKFLKTESNQSLFDWLNNTLLINTDDIEETYFFVYEKLQQFLSIILTIEYSKTVKQVLNESLKSSKRLNQNQNQIQDKNEAPTINESNNLIDHQMSNLNLNQTTDSITKEINAFDHELWVNDKKCDHIRDAISKISDKTSEEYKQLSSKLNHRLDRKEYFLKEKARLEAML